MYLIILYFTLVNAKIISSTSPPSIIIYLSKYEDSNCTSLTWSTSIYIDDKYCSAKDNITFSGSCSDNSCMSNLFAGCLPDCSNCSHILYPGKCTSINSLNYEISLYDENNSSYWPIDLAIGVSVVIVVFIICYGCRKCKK